METYFLKRNINEKDDAWRVLEEIATILYIYTVTIHIYIYVYNIHQTNRSVF